MGRRSATRLAIWSRSTLAPDFPCCRLCTSGRVPKVSEPFHCSHAQQKVDEMHHVIRQGAMPTHEVLASWSSRPNPSVPFPLLDGTEPSMHYKGLTGTCSYVIVLVTVHSLACNEDMYVPAAAGKRYWQKISRPRHSLLNESNTMPANRRPLSRVWSCLSTSVLSRISTGKDARGNEGGAFLRGAGPAADRLHVP